MGCLLWVQWWSHNKSWIQDIFSHLHSLHDLYAATVISGGKFSHFDMIVNSLMISMGAVECGLSV